MGAGLSTWGSSWGSSWGAAWDRAPSVAAGFDPRRMLVVPANERTARVPVGLRMVQVPSDDSEAQA